MDSCISCKCNAVSEKSEAATTFLPEIMTTTMAYVPFQVDISHYQAEDALKRGTLFSDLDKPFRGRCAV